MSDSDYLKNINFNFDVEKDIPELFVRVINLQAETSALRLYLINYLPVLSNKTEEEVTSEIDSIIESAKKEYWAQFAVERGE